VTGFGGRSPQYRISNEKENQMPIIQVEKKQSRTQIKAAIENDVQETLRAYCRFSGATSDQVVSGALKFLFQSDDEFKRWHELHKNDSQPRRGPRRRVPTDQNHNGNTQSSDKSLPTNASKR
jgi:hypothetical protein